MKKDKIQEAYEHILDESADSEKLKRIMDAMKDDMNKNPNFKELSDDVKKQAYAAVEKTMKKHMEKK